MALMWPTVHVCVVLSLQQCLPSMVYLLLVCYVQYALHNQYGKYMYNVSVDLTLNKVALYFYYGISCLTGACDGKSKQIHW